MHYAEFAEDEVSRQPLHSGWVTADEHSPKLSATPSGSTKPINGKQLGRNLENLQRYAHVALTVSCTRSDMLRHVNSMPRRISKALYEFPYSIMYNTSAALAALHDELWDQKWQVIVAHGPAHGCHVLDRSIEYNSGTNGGHGEGATNM